jgi:hypothetical protein
MSSLEESSPNSLTIHVAQSRTAMGADAAMDIAREIGVENALDS